jgi:hypothetical protein
LKDSTKKLINEQLKIIIKELDDILDPEDRVEQRLKLVELLADISEKIN